MKRFTCLLAVLCLMQPWARDALADGATATVRWVIDGDTVVLADGRTLRYIGIDAPEMEGAGRPAQPHAEKARALNRKWVQGRTVRLEFGAQRRDRYHRTLAHLFLPDGTMPARRLLAAGLAHCLPNRPNLKYFKEFLQIQREAMDIGRGQWEKHGEPAGALLGNRRSLRVHRPGCPFGRRTGAGNRIAFSTLWQAFYAGYAPCKKCLAGN